MATTRGSLIWHKKYEDLLSSSRTPCLRRIHDTRPRTHQTLTLKLGIARRTRHRRPGAHRTSCRSWRHPRRSSTTSSGSNANKTTTPSCNTTTADTAATVCHRHCANTHRRLRYGDNSATHRRHVRGGGVVACNQDRSKITKFLLELRCLLIQSCSSITEINLFMC